MNYSRQREAILNIMQSGLLDHPTADLVYAKLRKTFKKISLATVYRNLNHLAESNFILKIKTPNMPDRFDYRLEKHHHLVCKNCGKTIDVELRSLRLNAAALEQLTGFKIDANTISIAGTCNDCKTF